MKRPRDQFGQARRRARAVSLAALVASVLVLVAVFPSEVHPTGPGGAVRATMDVDAVAAPDACVVDADLRSAVAYASRRHERAAVAVYDTATGAYFAAGDPDAHYNTASVVKVFLAADLLLNGRMVGTTATTAYRMITTSDDDAAGSLYEIAGGDHVVTTMAQHYHIANLGAPPTQAGQWGETRITASGLVHLYAALRADPRVWPWLSDAMRHATPKAADGTDQYFGIPSATQGWAVKQGWMTGLGPGSTYDSTGFVDGDRYAVAILTYGSAAQYGRQMRATITQMARDTMPGGRIGRAGPASAACPGSA